MIITEAPDCPILQETLSLLRQKYGARWQKQVIDDFSAMFAFTVARLRSGSNGLCMSYQQLGRNALPWTEVESRTQRYKARIAAGDPVLEEAILKPRRRNMFDQALMVAIISALSQRFMNKASLAKDGIRCERKVLHLQEAAPEARSVVVIGFGGYLVQACFQPGVRKVVCADLLVSEPIKKAQFMRQLNDIPDMKGCLADKKFELTDGSDTAERLKEADVVCITGSAVASGTMHQLLEASRHATVIVEGLSCSFLPHAYFRRGVRYVVPSLVDLDILPLTHRYGQQFFNDEIRMNFGDYMDVLLPSYQTLTAMSEPAAPEASR